MPHATVTAQFVNPREGNRPASIKGSDGEYYSLTDEQFAQGLREKASYEIDYSVKNVRGRDYRNVSKIAPAASQGQQPAPAVNGRAGATKYGTTDDKTAERIFVCGALNAMLSNPGWNPNVVNVNSYVAIVIALRQTWERTFGGKPTMADEAQDEIPFQE